MRTRLLGGCSYPAGGVWLGADYNTTVAVRTSEMLVDRAIVRLFELRGLLKKLPDAN